MAPSMLAPPALAPPAPTAKTSWASAFFREALSFAIITAWYAEESIELLAGTALDVSALLV